VKKENSARGDVVDKSGLNKSTEYKVWKHLSRLLLKDAELPNFIVSI